MTSFNTVFPVIDSASRMTQIIPSNSSGGYWYSPPDRMTLAIDANSSGDRLVHTTPPSGSPKSHGHDSIPGLGKLFVGFRDEPTV